MNISELRIIVFLFQTESFIEEKSMLSVLAALTALLESITWPAITSGRLTALLLQLLFFVILTALEYRIPKMKLAPKGLWLSYRTNIMLFIFNGTVLSLVPVSTCIDTGPTLFRTRLAQLFLKPDMASLFIDFIARFACIIQYRVLRQRIG